MDAYYIDKYEVTNILYKACVKANACESPYSIYRLSEPDYVNYPVVYITWNQAVKYCAWRDAELPTESQWEKAARGIDERNYPWGNEQDYCSKANYNGCKGMMVKVGSYESGISPYGVYDMVGNAWEWVADLYDPYYYKTLDTISKNPKGPNNGSAYRVLRGGAWDQPGSTYDRSWLVAGKVGYGDIGFRCAYIP